MSGAIGHNKTVLLYEASMTPANSRAYDGVCRYAEQAGWIVQKQPYSLAAEKRTHGRAAKGLSIPEAVGHTVFDEIRAVRIERVKDLLMKPGQEVFAIPNLCGYGSLADLCRDFKKRTGQTLRGWRSSGAR